MDDEIVMLTLSLIGSAFCINHRQAIKAVDAQLLEIALYIFTSACVFTVIEGFILPVFLNISEHLAYLISSALVASWFYRTWRTNHTHLS